MKVKSTIPCYCIQLNVVYYKNVEEDDPYNQYGQTLPSLWEEFRCCHIEEGDNVNVDVTTPSAIVAVALTYLKSK
jgi:hypothetical protein